MKYLWPWRTVFLTSKQNAPHQNILECGPMSTVCLCRSWFTGPSLTGKPECVLAQLCLPCASMDANLSLRLLKLCLWQGRTEACLAYLLLCNLQSFISSSKALPLKPHPVINTDTLSPADIFFVCAGSLLSFFPFPRVHECAPFC